MEAWQFGLVTVAAFCGGAVNAVAGGGSFFSFPALLAVGVPPIMANASNSVALWPASLSGAWAYRAELARYRKQLVPLSIVSFIGGIAGSLILLATTNDAFSRLVPWLLLFATLLFASAPYLAPLLGRRKPAGQVGSSGLAGLAGQVIVAVYGGFFGAGMGIMMLAALAMGGHDDVHEINAIKNLLSAIIYSVTVLTFVAAGAIHWPYTLAMLAAATAGGFLGASFARRIPALWLRRVIISVGALLTAVYFFKTY